LSLAQSLTSHDCRVLAAFVALGLKQRQAPDWKTAWSRLTDLGRHQLLRTKPVEIFAAALDLWAASGKNAVVRGVRKATVPTMRKSYERQAVREIERAQIEHKKNQPSEAVA
jgi:hypothetical protein